MLCTFYGGYCSLWPNRTARSLSRAWPSLLRAHNHIGGATAVPLHHKKCLLCSVLIYIVLGRIMSARITTSGQGRRSGFESGGDAVNPERSFGGTNGSHRAKRANFGRGVRGSSPGKFQKPTWQMVQSTLFLSYICEYY